VQDAKTSKGDPPLSLTELTADIKFVVKKEGSAGLKIEIALVGADLGGEVKATDTHQIIVTFK